MTIVQLVQEKAEQASRLLDEFDIDCWITFVRESEITHDPVLELIVGSDVTWHSAFIFARGAGRIAIVGRFDAHSIEDTGVYDEVIGYDTGIREPLHETLRRIDPRQIAVNFSTGSEVCDGLTHGMYLLLRDLLAEIGMDKKLVSAETLIGALRQRKSPTEIDRIRRAVNETEDIFRRVGMFIKPGVSEIEIARFMKNAAEERGFGMAWQEANCPAVFVGPEAVSGHYGPTDRTVQPGHLVQIDFGIRADDYCSDLQRTFYVLRGGEEQPPEAASRAFATVVRAVQKAQQQLRPGVKGADIDAIARGEVIDAGYEEFKCALGHQVGRFAHDGTALLGPMWEKYADKPQQPVEPGMVFTLEPHIFVPEHGMASIEEMVLVTDSGSEFLSRMQTELRLIGR